MIVRDIARRLEPLGVPVLRPEQLHLPQEWQEEAPGGELLDGGRTGVLVYLEQHAPQGYLQLEPTYDSPAEDWLVNHLQVVAAVALTEERALELAHAARRLLCGTPQEPGAYYREMAGHPIYDPAGLYIVRNTYSRPEIDGDLAG